MRIFLYKRVVKAFYFYCRCSYILYLEEWLESLLHANVLRKILTLREATNFDCRLYSISNYLDLINMSIICVGIFRYKSFW